MAYLKLQYLSAALTGMTTIHAYLPTDAMSGSVPEPPYKTVYFLPGYSNDAFNMMSYLGLRRECELKGIAIVIPDGNNAFYVDHPERLSNYSTFVGKELVEITRKLLPLSDKREDTYIGGISMGGYGALYNGLRFRETFSKVIALSPAVSIYDLICGHDFMFPTGIFTNACGSKEEYFASEMNLDKFYAEVPKEEIPELYLCCGQQDGLVVDAVNRFVGVLDESEIPYIYRKGDGNHELDYWERHLDDAFSFLAGIEPGTKNRLVLGEFG